MIVDIAIKHTGYYIVELTERETRCCTLKRGGINAKCTGKHRIPLGDPIPLSIGRHAFSPAPRWDNGSNCRIISV